MKYKNRNLKKLTKLAGLTEGAGVGGEGVTKVGNEIERSTADRTETQRILRE